MKMKLSKPTKLDWIALCIFLVIKAINKAKALSEKKKEEEAAAAPAPKPDDVVLLEEIRDLLKNK